MAIYQSIKSVVCEAWFNMIVMFLCWLERNLKPFVDISFNATMRTSHTHTHTVVRIRKILAYGSKCIIIFSLPHRLKGRKVYWKKMVMVGVCGGVWGSCWGKGSYSFSCRHSDVVPLSSSFAGCAHRWFISACPSTLITSSKPHINIVCL